MFEVQRQKTKGSLVTFTDPKRTNQERCRPLARSSASPPSAKVTVPVSSARTFVTCCLPSHGLSLLVAHVFSVLCRARACSVQCDSTSLHGPQRDEKLPGLAGGGPFRTSVAFSLSAHGLSPFAADVISVMCGTQQHREADKLGRGSGARTPLTELSLATLRFLPVCTGVGCIVDGVPPRMQLTEEELQVQLDRRRPGQVLAEIETFSSPKNASFGRKRSA